MSTALESQPVEVFRAGNYGAKGTFTADDIARVAASYKPETHEAPVVIGHPKTDAPAWGWVKALKADGPRLMATFGQVAPEFAEMVEAGRFKKRSASFYRDSTGAITGLRHVGFLGAQPPDVKGLRDVQFHDEGRELTEVDFEENDMADTKQLEDSLFERLKALFKPAEPAAATFSEAEAKKIAEDAVKDVRAEMQQLITDFNEKSQRATTEASKNRAADAIAKLKREGKWLPAFEKMGLSVVFAELAKDDAVVEFGEGDDKKSTTAFDLLVEFMESHEKFVPAGRMVDGKPAGASKQSIPANADPVSVQFNEAIQARMKEKNETFEVAMDKVAQENPHLLAKAGSSSSGTV